MKKIVVVLGLLSVLMGIGIYIVNHMAAEAYTELVNQPVVAVTLSTGESFKIELNPSEAPNTVNNFIYLIEQGFYEGTKMNRVLDDYLVQGGDPIGNGKGFPGYFINSECKDNGVDNKIKHERGTVSMARSQAFNTEGSQFFILLQDDGYLDGRYSAFGRVIEGIEIIEAMSQLETNAMDYLINPITIESIELETYGITFEDPKVLSVEEVLAQYE